jgi:heme-degrading monooxygenase HmoA
MFTSTFIFEAKQYDDEFHRRNDTIAERARIIPGFLGEEEWHNKETALHAEVYYWQTREAMLELIGMPEHREAKTRHDRWIGEYRVVISEVETIYGNRDLGLQHQPAAVRPLEGGSDD